MTDGTDHSGITSNCALVVFLLKRCSEYRDAVVVSRVFVGSSRSTTVSTTSAISNHWAAIQYASDRGMPVLPSTT